MAAIRVLSHTETLPKSMFPCRDNEIPTVVVSNICSRHGIVETEPHAVILNTAPVAGFTVLVLIGVFMEQTQGAVPDRNDELSLEVADYEGASFPGTCHIVDGGLIRVLS